MYIKKIGHCCLLIKEQGLTLLTDPGNFTTGQDELTGIDVILITHEHQDHLHVESLKKVLKNNPSARIITNKSVGNILEKESIDFVLLSHGEETQINDVTIRGWGKQHADIYSDITPVENTGYFITQRFFYPGDALTLPEKSLDILALPIVGPWIKTQEAIEYALKVQPKAVFPVHDGMINEFGKGFSAHPDRVLTKAGISFHALKAGQEIEL
jgi:L-ascorbate metabolism protein UlaG (beta-lactamase superfamily)